MKFLISGVVPIAFILLTLQSGLTSCVKEVIIRDTTTITKIDTVTIRRTDTLTIKDTAMSEAILTANAWKIQEVQGVLEGTIIFYIRGGSSNTGNYDNDYYVFRPDKTGFSIDAVNGTHNISRWEFANPEKTKLVFTYFNVPSISSTITWDNIRYKNKSLHYDNYYTDNNTNMDYHGQEIRTPR
jgi:hypothetical protein